MIVKILCIGNLKEEYWRDACAEYTKRISRFSSINIVELVESKLPDKPSPAQIATAISEESSRILNVIKPNEYVVALDLHGKMCTSQEFADTLSTQMSSGNSSFAFVIGGSNGFDSRVIERANYTMSFSKLTFPHQLFRVMLCEQLYRCFKIINGEKYHK